MTSPCPGGCNSRWRDAERALALHGQPHDHAPTSGAPIWCPDCADAITARLAELDDLVALLGDEITGQRGGGGDAPITGSKGRPSPSPAVDDVDEIIRLAEYWEDATREHLALPRRPARAPAARVSAIRWLTRHAGDALAAPFAEELGRDVNRLHSMARRRTATDPAKVRKPAPCPGCDLLALVHADGDKYIGCDCCGRLLSFDEYDAWTRLLSADQSTATRRTA